MITSRQRRANDRARIIHNQKSTERQWIKLVRECRTAAIADAIANNGFRAARPGDLVVEMTSFRRDPDGIGILVAHGYDKRGDEIWSVQPLRLSPVRIHHWHNAEFRPLPPGVLQWIPKVHRCALPPVHLHSLAS